MLSSGEGGMREDRHGPVVRETLPVLYHVTSETARGSVRAQGVARTDLIRVSVSGCGDCAVPSCSPDTVRFCPRHGRAEKTAGQKGGGAQLQDGESRRIRPRRGRETLPSRT